MLNWHPFDQVPAWVMWLGIILALLLLPVTLAGALFGQDWSLMGLLNIIWPDKPKPKRAPG